MRLSRYAPILSLIAVLTAVPGPALAAPPPSAGSGTDLDAATIPDLQRQMDRGQLSAVTLTRKYLARIRSVDPKLHAVLALDPTALAQAAQSDARRRSGHTRGPLDGIPVLLKDNIDTKNLRTTAGSRALLGRPPSKDATLVRNLRDAGAVILGKTNLSEWANFRSTNSTSGWSGVGLQTNNPYELDRNPCGSSAGSGAAVAASLAQVAIGTETDGSIMCPSGANGIVGVKPSLGVVSGAGVVPISSEQDTAGPMARHVIDAALTLSALHGKGSADYSAQAGTLRGARIGIWRKAGIDPEVDRIVQASVDTMRARGATVVDVTLPYQDQVDANEFPALLAEFADQLPGYLATRPGAPRTMADLVAFDRRDPVELSKFGQELFEQALTAPGVDDPIYLKQRATATSLARRSIDETLAANHLDAIVGPSNSPAWVTSYGHGDDYELGSATPAAVAGYPNVSVPAGYSGELPVGVSFFAGRFADARVLSLAAAFEQAAPVRHAPKYLP